MNRIILYILFLFPLFLSAQTSKLAGYIKDIDGTFVNVEIKLIDDQGQVIATELTDQGNFSFPNLPSGYEYTLELIKVGNPLNGLSTFDQVSISRHLLGIRTLDSPYLEMAADIDGSGAVSIADIVYLRRLILGIISELPQKRNWLFIADDQTPTNPQKANSFTFQVDEPVVIKSFVILKVGDMNKTAILD